MIKSAFSSRLSRTPFPVRKLREMSAGFRSFVNLKEKRGGERWGGLRGYLKITIDTVYNCL